MWNRASDTQSLVLGGKCELSWVLSHLYEEQPTGWFIKGTAAHFGIEQAILHDLSFPEALDEALMSAERELWAARDQDVLFAPRSKSTIESMPAEIAHALGTWFMRVHPDSPERDPIYDDYAWPPLIEYPIHVESENLATTSDAIFVDGPPGGEIAIVDWKTGSKASAPPSQLNVYLYGLRKMRMVPRDQEFVGWFEHLAKDKRQLVNRYVGDDIVRGWLDATTLRKEALTETPAMPVVNPGFLCSTCPSQKACPLVGEGEWSEVLVDLDEAERETFLDKVIEL